MTPSSLIASGSNPQARLRLFCFPYAGGDSHIYQAWPTILPSWIEVAPIQLPGRGRRLHLEPYADLTKLVADLADAIEPLLDRDYAFFGHSMGALIAFELARQIRRLDGPAPRALFASGFRAPQLKSRLHGVSHLPDDEFIALIASLGGTPKEVLDNVELMALVLPALRGDVKIVESYAFVDERPLETPIIALGGQDDDSVSDEALRAWGGQTLAPLSAKFFPGGHFFVHSAQSAVTATVARHLSAVMG